MTREDCDFYHTSVLQDGSVVPGHWDLRGAEASYFGGVSFEGSRVLELGPASGHLTFYLEDQGAEVVSFEAGFDTSIDVLPPFVPGDMAPIRAELMAGLARVNNSWWFMRHEREAKAKIVYGNIYDMPSDLGMFDVTVYGSILLHLSNPFRALEQGSHRTSKRMIVADMLYSDLDDPTFLTRVADALRWRSRKRPGRIGGGDPSNVLRFSPAITHRGASTIWWQFSPGSIVNMLDRLGFPKTTVTFHAQKLRPDGDMTKDPVEVSMFTVVGERA